MANERILTLEATAIKRIIGEHFKVHSDNVVLNYHWNSDGTTRISAIVKIQKNDTTPGPKPEPRQEHSNK